MARIHILDEQTIDQIAAGEVVERPVSVVKELVENALDAGATEISVEILGGGTDLIRITDNGCGIPADQVRTAFFRHATSKIDTAEDLFALTSLGFRGEALSSIASVAKVELVTRTADAETGTRYVIEGGQEVALEECGAPEGTRFTVRDLFYNTPVRRGFLKSPQTEGSYIVTLMEQLSLSRPGISMRLSVDGKTKLQTSAAYRMKDVIYTLFGREVAAHLRAVDYTEKGQRVFGYIGEPVVNRGNRGGELCFVNGRFVKNALMMKAIEQAYHGLTMQHKFPVAILQLTLEPELVDVNVHPNKTEVRFRAEKDVFDVIYHAVREALFAKDLIPTEGEAPQPEKKTEEPAVKSEPAGKTETMPKTETVSKTEPALVQPAVQPAAPAEPIPQPEKVLTQPVLPEAVKIAPAPAVLPEKPPVIREIGDYRVDEDRRLLDRFLEKKPAQLDLFSEKLLAPGQEKQLRLIGQLFETYWLLEYGEWFLLADQHAVHEKILYERTMKNLAKKEATSQQVDPPLFLSLSGAQAETLRRYADAFANLGFEINHLGGRDYSLSAVPDNLFGLAAQDLFTGMLDELGEERLVPASMLDDKVALMSCKAAVKGNQKLSFAEAEALFRELMTLDNPYTCPHGRPTMIRMSRTEIEKKFKRIV